MTVPNRSISIQNGGNGVSVGSGVVRACVGVSSAGTINQVYSYTAPADVATHGIGPLVDAAKLDLEQGGGTVLVVRAKDSVAGSITTATPNHVGDGTCTCTGTPNNRYRIAVEITTAGERGTGAFKYALDAGPDDTTEEKRNWSLPVAIPTGGAYTIPNTGLVLTFTNGTPVSFQLGDTFTFATTAPSFQLADLQAALAALKAYATRKLWVHVVGEITAAIAVGCDTWATSMQTDHKYLFLLLEAADLNPVGAVTASGTTPPTLTVTGLPEESWDVSITVETGGALGTMTFKYSLDGGNTYSAEITSTAVTGINPIEGTGMTFAFASAAYNADNAYTFSTWDKETNRAVWDSGLRTAYVAFTSDRVAVCAGHGECALTDGSIVRTNIAWGVSPLLARISASTDAGQVEDAGKLPGFMTLSHDEALHPGLDDAGFLTGRTWDNIAGLFINQPRIFAAAGSDYDLIQYRRVMDNACTALDAALARKVNKKVRVDSSTGHIDERDAQTLDRAFLTAVEDVTTVPGDASGVVCRTQRDENLLSTRLLSVDLEVVGVAYIKTLAARIGYKNPALVPV